MKTQQNVMIMSDTIPRYHVHNHARDVLGHLFCDHETINVYIMVVDEIPCPHTLVVGTCDRINETSWVIRICNRYDWKFTLSHEIYHVFQSHDGLPLNHVECDQFARMVHDNDEI